MLCVFMTWNYLNLLGAWELSNDKNEWSEQCQFLVKRVKCCLTWVNCVLQSLPLLSILVYGVDYWLWGNRVVDWKKGSELALTSYFETTLFFLYFSLFNIILNSIKNQWFKCSVVRRRKGLVEFGIAFLHVIEVGYNTPHRRRAENTKRFGLASLGRYSNLRIKL